MLQSAVAYEVEFLRHVLQRHFRLRREESLKLLKYHEGDSKQGSYDHNPWGQAFQERICSLFPINRK